ncbi:MAG: family 10 glycosylhydrolase [Muribaculaceae bacterium]|nr:family 10 glycosylhydrolase [Muribaculaceae bacterium]
MQKFAIRLILLLSILFFSTKNSIADTYPKREMRSAWLATVWNLDWPKNDAGSAYTGTTSTVRDNQKTYLRNMIQKLKASGFNAVNFQVRSMCDAMYNSSYEPWSSALTGARGTAPYGNWDPLAYCVEVCHEFGMECHAWVNPFRFCTSATLYSTTKDMTLRNNGWIITYAATDENGDVTSTTSVLNPGIEDVRNYIVENVCKEIVQNYDIDGLVWDDYFYPNGIPSTIDVGDYPQYQSYINSGGTMNMGDWRRDNVNKTVKLAFDMIQREKPYVKFGIAPAGVANVGAKAHGIEPAKISSNGYQYNGIFADPCAWIIDGYIDYISPQLYWTTNHQSAPFNPLCEWWNNLAATYGVQCYISHDIAGSTSTWNNNSSDYTERFNQIAQVRNSSADFNPGEVFYSAGFINGPRTSGLGDYLKENLYQHYALTPKVVRSDEETIIVNPGTVDNIALNGSTLSWSGKNMSITGYNLSNIPMRYAVYAIPLSIGVNDAKSTIHTNDGGFKADYLLDITYNNSFDVSSYSSSSYWYAVTIVDRFGYEWEAATLNAPNLGNVSLSLNSPATASVLSFGDNTFSWTSDGTSFTFQISTSEGFTAPLIEQVVTTKNITFSTADLTDGTTYYWRVIASKESYNSAWSEIRSFTMETRPTIAITLLTPENTSTINTETIPFSWEGIDGASYTFELAEYTSFNNILISTTTTATSYEIPTTSLTGGKTYFWRIKASRDGYQSSVSDYASFITPKVEGETVDGLTIEKKWIKSVNTGNFPEELNACVSARSMAAYNGNVYILERASSDICSLYEFDGNTGAYIKTISLTGDCYKTSSGNSLSYPCNSIFVDGAGNLCIANMSTSIQSTPLIICTVNISTGYTTRIFESSLNSSSYRIDYSNAFNDVTTTGGQIWAATTTNKVFRWTRNSDGSWTEASTTINGFYPSDATSLGNAPSIQPISSSQFIVDGASTHPTLYSFNSGGNATLVNSFANNAAIQPTNTNYNGTYSITIGSTPLFIYVDNIHSFSIVANKHNFDFAQFQFMKSVPENKLGTTGHSWNLDQPVAINNNDGSVTVFLYAPKNGLAAYRISLPDIPITLNSPTNDAKPEEGFDFSWTGVEGATYTLELSKTSTFDNIAFSTTTTATSYSSSNFNLASETKYYWRVKASCDNYIPTTSEVRTFTSPYKESTTGDLSIEELWNYNISNLPTQLTGDNKRSMTAYNGNIYFTYRASKSELYLLEFNGKTGDFIRQITLTGACVTGEYGANGIFVDGGNNLCVVSMGTSSTIPATVCTVDISTGQTTQIFSYGAADLRFDYMNARGDITKTGGEIWAASSKNSSITTNNNRIYRWTRKSDGTWTTASTVANSFYPTTGETGITPWVLPISSTQFIVDGSGNYPSLYTFKAGGYATLDDGFNSSSELKPAAIGGVGMHQLEIGDYPLFVYSNETHEGAGFNFNIAYNPSSYDFANLELFWTIPEVNMGKTNHQYGLNSIASIKNDDNSATVYVYAPKNGLAAYRIYLPDMPITLNSPIDNVQTLDGFDFTWSGVDGAKYTIELSTSESFDNIAFSATTEDLMYISYNFNLAGSTKYYWRIKASHDNYTTTTSAVAQFISPEKPTMTPPKLFVPYNGTTHSSDISFVAKKSYILNGEEKIYASKYILEISRSDDFSDIFYSGDSKWKEKSSEESNYEIWLQYTLPISLFPNGTYYWRVIAQSNNSDYGDGISEVRSFIVVDQYDESTTYKMVRENSSYSEIGLGGNNYISLYNNWIRSATYNNGISQANGGTYARGFCVRPDKNGEQNGMDIIYIPNDDKANANLDYYNAATGEFLGTLQMTATDGTTIATSTYPCNGLFVDNAGNLCFYNLAGAGGVLQLCTVDVDLTKKTAVATERFSYTVTNRVDHCRAYGDVASKDFTLFGAASETNTIYRWSVSGSNVDFKNKSISTNTTNFGYNIMAFPVSENLVYINGNSSNLALYDFDEGKYKNQFTQSNTALCGGGFFIHNNAIHFMVYPNTGGLASQHQYKVLSIENIANGNSGSTTRWNIPTDENALPAQSSDKTYGTMLIDYLPKLGSTTKSANRNPNTTSVYLYVPGSGLASYSITSHIVTGAENIESNSIKIATTQDEIKFGGEVDNAQIYTLSGMLINSVDNASSIEKPANKGVYILRLTIEGITTIHKIII